MLRLTLPGVASYLQYASIGVVFVVVLSMVSMLVGVLTPQPEERAIGEGFRGVRGETYFLGVIDILECWKLRWRVQGAILKLFFRYVACSRWYNPGGITAIHPDDYAERFVEFFGIHVLGLPPTATPQGGKTWHPYW